MSETNKETLPRMVPTDEVLGGFSWAENAKPETVSVNNSGFLEDREGNWYLLRRAMADLEPEVAQPTDLYNGSKHGRFNSTEGSGLYFANTPEALRRLYIRFFRPSKEPQQLYVCKIRPESDAVLDVTGNLRALNAGQRAAALVMRARGVAPIILPSPKTYDRLYGDAEMVTTPPPALPRMLMSGRAVEIANEKVKPRWAIVRNTEALTVVAHASADELYSGK